MSSLLSRFFGSQREATVDAPPWLDRPDAAQMISVAKVSDEARQAAMDLVTKGFTVLRGMQDPATCARVIEDYYRFGLEHPDYVNANKDCMGREKRMVNFHRYSDAAMQLGTNPRLMEILDFLFAAEACVYTSLTFKFGTQQPVHRDTPHFATWPDGHFFGVWNALEDISPDAGPLFYYEGAHRFPVDVPAIWARAKLERPDFNEQQQLEYALDLYNGEVIQRAPDNGEHRLTSMKRGDVAIWHPQLPHGGSPANDQMASRWSMVFHVAPKDKQVHQHGSFFKSTGHAEPPPRYGFTEAYGRQIALAGEVAYQA